MVTKQSSQSVRFVTDLPPEVADWLKAKAAASFKKPAPYIRDHFVNLYNEEQQQNGKGA